MNADERRRSGFVFTLRISAVLEGEVGRVTNRWEVRRARAHVYTTRIQVYLPADLYEIVKQSHLSASELLQKAVRTEVRRRELLASCQKYTDELAAEVGQPSSEERVRAEGVARRIGSRGDRKAG